jgi:Raf kinase inhibitor-like YbhB/YbcL family protein
MVGRDSAARFGVAAAVLAVSAFAGGPGKGKGVIKMGLEVKSSAFKNAGEIPRKFTCDGQDVSPGLAWTGLPKATKSLAIIMDDPDAPPGTWVHWILYDIPGDSSGLEEGVPKKEALGNGAKHGLCWGVEDFDRVGYYGPCPPPGTPHRYYFKVYALDKALGIAPRATKNGLLKAMEGHILAQGELMGKYKR